MTEFYHRVSYFLFSIQFYLQPHKSLTFTYVQKNFKKILVHTQQGALIGRSASAPPPAAATAGPATAARASSNTTATGAASSPPLAAAAAASTSSSLRPTPLAVRTRVASAVTPPLWG
jgi:hypothetical protein